MSDRETSPTELTVGTLAERGLLQRLQAFCPREIVGDDAAVLPLDSDRVLVVTSDMLVDGVHFSDRSTSAADAGWRAAAANLSDLAAMGATPWGITVALGLRSDQPVTWVEELYAGMSACLQPSGTQIWGGDISRSETATIAITAIGQAPANRVWQRSAAQPGDAIVATGIHGASRAGLELLLHPESNLRLETAACERLRLTHQRPKPRLDVVPVLRAIAAESRTAAADSSDGLVDAVWQLCASSGVGARLDATAVPQSPDVIRYVGTELALEWALYGGEDFELVLCLPPELAQQLVAAIGGGAAIVGEILPGSEVVLMQANSTRVLTIDKTFQHF
ncbi:thiamine-monophosphate kinase [Rubidibacter lacunae KORDI 51-2]|uniref:Thiamine-monophosphate kinase n=1 Tax=Rubidibacter lacunae KORDI 51-2 TaxID=582515 RepID=U5DN55_9CHRO|nr:thiamine-phosphate kinase [Rubidibacter lacunae]ERN42054.1 thiamine-monophosphate kinase [Rubidibacter lacunae KORDI 51-2]